MSKIPKYLASLEGRIETISMMELRSSPGRVMTAVECGKTFIITRSKKPIARLSKIKEEDIL